MTVQEYYRRMQRVNLNELKVKAAEKNKRLLLDLNREQLSQGLRADGQKITPEYRSHSYALSKRVKNLKPGYGIPDLYLTGRFYATLTTETEGMELKVKTGVDYGEKLREKYPDIFGLTPKSLGQAQQRVTSDFIKLWQQKIRT